MARSGSSIQRSARSVQEAGGQFSYNTRKAGRSAWSVRSQLIACPGNQDAEDAGRASQGHLSFVSEDKSRPILNLVLDTGEYLVATNGAMLVMTDAATPKGRSPALREPSTGRVKPSVVKRTTDAKGKVTEQTLTVKDFLTGNRLSHATERFCSRT